MEFTQEDADALRRILAWRRDVRHFRADPVDETVLERLRAAMDRAPSVGNSRPWRVLRIEDPALRAAVRDNFRECNQAAAADFEQPRRDEYLRLKLAGLDAAPVQLAVFTEIDPAQGHGLGRATMPETLRQSTAMAVHTLWLAARAENLGLGMVSILDPRAIEKLLTAPPNWEFSAYLCIGYPVSDDDTPLLHRAGWQENASTRWERV
ncbi:MAG: 5,6-dimethylbenzimidazole synthase [Dichotomicrobium sp.]